MALVEWTEKMSVGVDTLDRDHQRLVGLLNQLDAEARNQRDPATLEAILDDLIQYTEYHFAAEEQLMRLARYPDYEKHCEQHQTLRNQVLDFRRQVHEDPQAISIFQVFQFLSDWLMRHILQEDQRYRPYVAQDARADVNTPPDAGPSDPAAPVPGDQG